MRKKNQLLYKVLFVSCLFISISTILCAFGCFLGIPEIDIILENQTDQVLTICENSHVIGDVIPGEEITIKGSGNIGKYPINAKNSQGEIVFSQVYSYPTNLEEINSRTYKGIIPPLE